MNRKWSLFFVLLALFVCWLAYLGWLVLNRPLQAPGFPLVVSRPQVLASEVDVIVELQDKSGKAKVVKVLYEPPGKEKLKPGDVIQIDLIDECRPIARVRGVVPPNDWDGAGNYLVPMRAIADGKEKHYQVAPVPMSPGFVMGGLVPPVRIYRDSPDVVAQYEGIKKPDPE